MISIKTALIICLIVLTNSLFAQHTIKLYSGDTLRVKVTEITERTTTYKLPNYFDGPAIIISNSKIEQIVYPNGEVISFDKDSPLGKENFIHKKNSIEILLSEISVGRLGFGYNRQLGNNFNLRLSGAFRISQNQLFYPNFDIKNYLSLEGMYFPLGHRRVAFFTGLKTMIGQSKYGYYYNDYYSSYYVSPSVKTFGSAQILNGLQINISQSFNIHALWSTGFILSQDENHHQETINQGTISIGFKF